MKTAARLGIVCAGFAVGLLAPRAALADEPPPPATPAERPEKESTRWELARAEFLVGGRTDYSEDPLAMGGGMRFVSVRFGVVGLTLLEAYGWESAGGYYYAGLRPFVEIPLVANKSLALQLGLGVGAMGGLAERVGRDFDGHGLALSPSLHVLCRPPGLRPLFFGGGVMAFAPFPGVKPFAGNHLSDDEASARPGATIALSLPIGLEL